MKKAGFSPGPTGPVTLRPSGSSRATMGRVDRRPWKIRFRRDVQPGEMHAGLRRTVDGWEPNQWGTVRGDKRLAPRPVPADRTHCPEATTRGVLPLRWANGRGANPEHSLYENPASAGTDPKEPAEGPATGNVYPVSGWRASPEG